MTGQSRPVANGIPAPPPPGVGVPAAPVLFVAGLGRCGTTLAMTMLDAGGFPVTGPRPGYEPAERWQNRRPDLPWLHAQGGRAVKWIDPLQNRVDLSAFPVRPVVILLDRNPRQQARSQLKLIGAEHLGRHGETAMKRSIQRDMARLGLELRKTAQVYPFSFERLLRFSASEARLMATVIDRHFNRPFDRDTATKVVINRPARCAPDLLMESVVLPALAQDMPPPADPLRDTAAP